MPTPLGEAARRAPRVGHRLVRALMLAAIALPACNALLGTVEDITYGPPDDGTVDGSRSDRAIDGSGIDGANAGSDAFGDDRTAPPDATIPPLEGGDPDADAAVCPTLFTSNFDPPEDLPPYGWPSLDVSGATVTSTTFFAPTTPPAAIEITAPGTGTTVSGMFVRPLSPCGRTVWDFDLLIVVTPSSPGSTRADVLDLLCGAGAGSAHVSLSGSDLRLDFLSETGVLDIVDAGSVASNWHHITATFDVGQMAMSIDNGPKSVLLHDCSAATEGRIGLSTTVAAGLGNYDVILDSVRLSK